MERGCEGASGLGLVARWAGVCHCNTYGRGANVSWCELVRVNDDRGEAIDGQGGRRHIKIGPGENGRKEKRNAPDEGNAGAGTGMD
jgi:hypothetical protein